MNQMVNRWLISSAAVLMIWFGSHAIAAKPLPDIPAMATFRCGVAIPFNVLQLSPCGSSNDDRIRGDDKGKYATVLNVNREFNLTLSGTDERVVFLDFRDCPTCVPNSRRDFDWLLRNDVIIQTNVVDASGAEVAGGLQSIPVNGWSRARLKIAFNRLSSAGQTILWAVRFNPETYPGSDHVLITRTATNAWEIEASSTDRALLVSSILRKNATDQQEGPFYMPFKMAVTTP